MHCDAWKWREDRFSSIGGASQCIPMMILEIYNGFNLTLDAAAAAWCGSCTAEVEFEFTTWAWVQATAETAFCGGLVVRSPGSIKALNQSTHNSLGHCRNVHLAVAGHCRKFILPWPATAEWTFRQWPRELWVDWFNAFTEPGDQTTRPLPNAVSAVAWTQAQVVNSNSTSRVKETPHGVFTP